MNGIATAADIPTGPHSRIDVSTDRERFATQLFDVLWDRYRSRVSYVRDYEQVIASAGATFVNDHIAFRTLAGQRPLTGIATLSRIFEALGYLAAGCYNFPDKHLNAIHYQHANPAFPKLFLSELRIWELPDDVGETLERLLESHRDPVTREQLQQLCTLKQMSAAAHLQLLNMIVDEFHSLPWDLPDKAAVQVVNAHSQYAAWVMVHGYNVNHFTSSINSQGVDSLNDIEKTVTALKNAGVPMKTEIEGERGSKLRQTATEAVTIDVDLTDGGKPATMPWSYAYFELAERNDVTDPETGKKTRFEGFLGPQATNLFEMTRVRSGN
jgi:2-oxoadipate dioxygenase/decarboxylase